MRTLKFCSAVRCCFTLCPLSAAAWADASRPVRPAKDVCRSSSADVLTRRCVHTGFRHETGH